MIIESAVNEVLENDDALSKLIDSNNIFLIDIPPDYQKVEKAPLIRINTIQDAPILYASNVNLDDTYQVAISVWTKKIKDLEPFVEAVDNAMANDGWFLYYRFPIEKDPDIDLYMISRRYTKTFFKK